MREGRKKRKRREGGREGERRKGGIKKIEIYGAGKGLSAGGDRI